MVLMEDDCTLELATLVHVARKHESNDPDAPCLVSYPGPHAYCGGPQTIDRNIARELLAAGWSRG